MLIEKRPKKEAEFIKQSVNHVFLALITILLAKLYDTVNGKIQLVQEAFLTAIRLLKYNTGR